MMKLTDTYYARMKNYQSTRAELTEEHEKALQGIEPFKGSKGYTDKKRELDDDFSEKLTSLQDEYRQALNTIMDGMETNLKKRGIKPPTNDMLNLITMLKMKEHVSEDDLDRVAQMMDGNPIALGILSEMAKSNNIFRNYSSLCNEMSTDRASEELQGLRKWTEDFIRYDTSYPSRIYVDYERERWGKNLEAVKRQPFTDEESCFNMVTGLKGDELKLFSEAVDGESKDD